MKVQLGIHSRGGLYRCLRGNSSTLTKYPTRVSHRESDSGAVTDGGVGVGYLEGGIGWDGCTTTVTIDPSSQSTSGINDHWTERGDTSCIHDEEGRAAASEVVHVHV